MNKMEKILIVRTDRIGDVVLTLPLPGIIKKHMPQAKVFFLLRNYTYPLAEGNPFVEQILTLPEEKGKANFLKTLKLLRKYDFDAAIIVSPKLGIALAAFLAKIKIRVGTAYRWYSFLFNKKVFDHRRKGNKHELEFNVRMLSAIGINEKVSKGNVSFNVQVNSESERKVKNLLKAKGWNENLKTVIIHPGSGKSAIDLPFEKMKMLAGKLAHNLNLNLILTGNKNEREMCESLTENRKVINTAGEFNLKELIALISIADLLIANSTGPIHIAAALDVKTIGFYPNVNECSSRRWGPYSLKSFVFSPQKDCLSCENKNENNCMAEIDVDDVLRKTEEFLDEN